jgi:hypothetical protein
MGLDRGYTVLMGLVGLVAITGIFFFFCEDLQKPALQVENKGTGLLNESKELPEFKKPMPSSHQTELENDVEQSLKNTQLAFLESVSWVMYEHEMEKVTKQVMQIFDTQGDGLLTIEEAPFMLALANQYIPVNAIKVKRTRSELQINEGVNTSKFENFQDTVIPTIITITESQVLELLRIAYHKADFDGDGRLFKDSDLPFLGSLKDPINY